MKTTKATPEEIKAAVEFLADLERWRDASTDPDVQAELDQKAVELRRVLRGTGGE